MTDIVHLCDGTSDDARATRRHRRRPYLFFTCGIATPGPIPPDRDGGVRISKLGRRYAFDLDSVTCAACLSTQRLHTELKPAIEGPETDHQLHLASGARLFWDILLAHTPYLGLVLLLTEHQELRGHVHARILQLARVPAGKHEHPHDAALAVYLWALAATEPERAHDAAALRDMAPDIERARLAAGVVRYTQSMFWARLVAKRILDEVPLASESAP